MKFTAAILMLILSFLNCPQRNTAMKIKYFSNGKEKSISIPRDNVEELTALLRNLISGIDDEARLVVDDERIEMLKQNDNTVEIVFEKKQKFNSAEFSEYPISKILIPLSGDLSTTENENAVVIFLGKNIYDSSPYINQNGKSDLKKIIAILRID